MSWQIFQHAFTCMGTQIESGKKIELNLVNTHKLTQGVRLGLVRVTVKETLSLCHIDPAYLSQVAQPSSLSSLVRLYLSTVLLLF